MVALRSADLVVEPGEVHALLGANGAGKSTLVKILTGVIPADRGTVAVNGKSVRIGSPARRGADRARAGVPGPGARPRPDRRREPAPDAAPTPTPCGASCTRWTSTSTSASSSATCRCPLLRMIDLARALSRDPQLLLLDEITAALPSDLAERVFAVMRAQRERGPLGALHHAPAQGGDPDLRPRDDPARRRRGRDDRPARRAARRRSSRTCSARRPPAAAAAAAEQPPTPAHGHGDGGRDAVARGRRPDRSPACTASRSRSPPARCSGSPRSRARARTSSSTRSPAPLPPTAARSASPGSR